MELEYNDHGYALSTDTDGCRYLHHRDGGKWRVATRLEDMTSEVEAFYRFNEFDEGKALDFNLEELCRFTNLKMLVLIRCEITSLPPEIGNLTNLTELDLGDNPISRSEIEKIERLLPWCWIRF